MGDIWAYVHTNMKFLCLTMCQGEVCTDNDDINNDNAQRMIIYVHIFVYTHIYVHIYVYIQTYVCHEVMKYGPNNWIFLAGDQRVTWQEHQAYNLMHA